MALAVGVDVAARRGCDVVALGDDLVAHAVGRVGTAAELRALLDVVQPDVVAIDAPRRWARSNTRRDCERELTARGLCLFTTPSEERGVGHSFYEWMTVGFEMFEATTCRSLETFPHAVAVTVHECLPPVGVTRRLRAKREWRLEALRRADVDVTELATLDEVDAALCAYTGHMWCEGLTVDVGDDDDDRITLPVAALLDRYVRASAPPTDRGA